MTRRKFFIIMSLLPLLGAGCRHVGSAPESRMTDAQRNRCYDTLLAALADASPYVRVHAAEALVASGRPQPALDAFRPIADTPEPKYRVVVWRVLAAAEPEMSQRKLYVERIRKAFVDTGGPDRTHASESLAKLNEPVADDVERRLVRQSADAAGSDSPFALWRLAQAGDATAAPRLVNLLRANDAETRLRAAYVLGRIEPLPRENADALSTALAKEPVDSPARPVIRAALGGDEVRALARDAQGPPAGRYFAAMYLADAGAPSDQAILSRLLDDPDSDVRVAAAYALLRIDTSSVQSVSSNRAGR